MDTSASSGVGTLRIHLLGGFRLDGDDGTPLTLAQPRLQNLLAYLLLHRQSPVPRQQLAFALWPDSTEQQAHSNLRNLLHRLRAALPGSEQFLQYDHHQVWWRQPDACWSDVAEFNAALARAAAAEAAGDLPAACQALETAVALYEGDLLPSCYDDWIAAERERLHLAQLRALSRLITLLEGLRPAANHRDWQSRGQRRRHQRGHDRDRCQHDQRQHRHHRRRRHLRAQRIPWRADRHGAQ